MGGYEGRNGTEETEQIIRRKRWIKINPHQAPTFSARK
jgi:hypothetical protein